MKLLLTLISLCLLGSLQAQENPKKKQKKKVIPPFKWVNTLPTKFQLPGLIHKTFKSSSMGLDVGYCIYIPKAYNENSSKKFPRITSNE